MAGSGEGAPGYAGRGVSSEEVCALRDDPAGDVLPWSAYTDNTISTFGAPNQWRSCPDFNLRSQELKDLEPCPAVGDPADIDGNGVVDTEDLLILLAAFGDCPQPCPPTCPADITGDCTVNTEDLLALLAAWG